MAGAVRGRGVARPPGEELVEWSFFLAVEGSGDRRAEVRAAAAGLVEAAAAEARAVGAQLRCIHRLWRAAQAARTAARAEAVAAAGGVVRADRLGALAEPEHQLVVDVAAEVGPALRLPAGTAQRRVEDAVLLAEMLPEVLGALEGGRIGWAQAVVLVEQWRELIEEVPESTVPGGRSVPPPVEAVHRLIAELLERAPRSTAAQLRAVARARREVLVAEAEERARRHARKRRGVWVEPAPEGMAYLHALLEAPVAVAAQARVAELAALIGEKVPAPGLGVFPDLDAPEHVEARCARELEADVLADLLLEGVPAPQPGVPGGIRARVSVTVPVTVLTGTGSGSGVGSAGGGAAVLGGYGPIGAEVARQLAAGAGSWHRLLTHPVTGVVLDHDRTVYAVPADLRRLVEWRDGTCRFPGCRRRAEACELDHTVAWAQGGSTAEHNLAALCRTHHRIKHRAGALGRWTVRRIRAGDGPGGRDGTGAGQGARTRAGTGGGGGQGSSGTAGDAAVLEWTSPGGLVHRTVPEHALPTETPEERPQIVEPPPDDQPDHAPPPAEDPGACDPRAYDPADDPAPF